MHEWWDLGMGLVNKCKVSEIKRCKFSLFMHNGRKNTVFLAE
jgi:hypothetical protein